MKKTIFVVLLLLSSCGPAGGRTKYQASCVSPNYSAVVTHAIAANNGAWTATEVETGLEVNLPMDRCILKEVK